MFNIKQILSNYLVIESTNKLVPNYTPETTDRWQNGDIRYSKFMFRNLKYYKNKTISVTR